MLRDIMLAILVLRQDLLLLSVSKIHLALISHQR